MTKQEKKRLENKLLLWMIFHPDEIPECSECSRPEWPDGCGYESVYCHIGWNTQKPRVNDRGRGKSAHSVFEWCGHYNKK